MISILKDLGSIPNTLMGGVGETFIKDRDDAGILTLMVDTKYTDKPMPSEQHLFSTPHRCFPVSFSGKNRADWKLLFDVLYLSHSDLHITSSNTIHLVNQNVFLTSFE